MKSGKISRWSLTLYRTLSKTIDIHCHYILCNFSSYHLYKLWWNASFYQLHFTGSHGWNSTAISNPGSRLISGHNPAYAKISLKHDGLGAFSSLFALDTICHNSSPPENWHEKSTGSSPMLNTIFTLFQKLYRRNNSGICNSWLKNVFISKSHRRLMQLPPWRLDDPFHPGFSVHLLFLILEPWRLWLLSLA